MTKQDNRSWTDDEDLMIAEAMLNQIRKNLNREEVLEELGKKFGRTSGAVGFRWYSKIRKQYKQAVEIAKKAAKNSLKLENIAKEVNEKADEVEVENKIIEEPVVKPTDEIVATEPIVEATIITNELTMDKVIEFLSNLEKQPQTNSAEVERLIAENETLKNENEVLRNRNGDLEHSKLKTDREFRKLEQDYEQIKADYTALVQIMERARDMFDRNDKPKEKPAHSFKMDRNGNLQRVEK
jgi:prespore-specific regulator